MSTAARLLNALPALVLHSPAHRVLSGRYAVLEFTGRRTGRTYRTPIAYVRDGSRVLLSTDSPWWRNLLEQPRVRLRIRGREVVGSARVIDDDAAAAAALRELVERVRGYSRPAGVQLTGGRVTDGELVRAVTTGGRRSIEVQLEVRR